jgi:hypothetical protein
MKYNLKYRSKKTGMIVMGKRLGQFTRKIELSTGEVMSCSWASNNLEYLGRYEPETGHFVEYEKPHFETIITPNGFKIAKQMSK